MVDGESKEMGSEDTLVTHDVRTERSRPRNSIDIRLEVKLVPCVRLRPPGKTNFSPRQ
jgi:hypothetical protein